MRNQKKIILEELDKKLKPFNGTEKFSPPFKGWIFFIRTSLNMTLEQLGNKLNITRQAIKKIEDREANENITIKSLKEVATALNMHFVYGFVPKHGTVENLVDVKAEELAQKLFLKDAVEENTNHFVTKKSIAELKKDIKRELNKSLWD